MIKSGHAETVWSGVASRTTGTTTHGQPYLMSPSRPDHQVQSEPMSVLSDVELRGGEVCGDEFVPSDQKIMFVSFHMIAQNANKKSPGQHRAREATKPERAMTRKRRRAQNHTTTNPLRRPRRYNFVSKPLKVK